MDVIVKIIKSGIIGGVFGGILFLYVIINILLIFNFFIGFIVVEKF